MKKTSSPRRMWYRYCIKYWDNFNKLLASKVKGYYGFMKNKYS